MICAEHGLNQEGGFTGSSDSLIEKIDVYFHADLGRFVPRAILVDLDTSPLDSIKAGSYGKLFRQDNFVVGKYGTNNNYPRGANLLNICKKY